MPISGYFNTVFGESGTLATVPDDVQPDGSVSYEQGYSIDYTLTPGVTGAKNIEQDKFNQILFDATTAIQGLQQHVAPLFITSAMNGGSAFSYSLDDIVRYNPGSGLRTYISLEDSNTDVPGSSAKWARFSPRIALVGSTNFYVTTSGNDSTGNGSVGAPWATIQGAIDTLVRKYDGRGFNPTINVGTGSFAGFSVTNPIIGGTLIINGNGSANTNIAFAAGTGAGREFQIQNANIANGSGAALSADQGARIIMGAGLAFGTSSTQMIRSTNYGNIQINTAFNVNGNATALVSTRDGGLINVAGAALVTVTGAGVTLTTVAESALGGNIDAANLSFTGGAVTGTRYSVSGNGIINTGGMGVNFFPGSIAGSFATGGQYI